MCGIAGIARAAAGAADRPALARMAAALRHRGPDAAAVYTAGRVGFAHARLSIVDVAGGAQPLRNEDGSVVVTYNGEVYNHLELRRELEGAGHRFRTRCDTEVLVHGYEEWGEGLMARLNGQFAFAIHDRARESVLLARDRFGICPLLYTVQRGALYFASEAKALFASGEVAAAPDLAGLDEVFTFWAARAPRTPFRDVRALEPGRFAVWRDGRLRTAPYYALAFAEDHPEPRDALEQLDALLRSAVSIRLQADVPVGAYLSGGLDSSAICALAADSAPELRTFSVTFDDPALDESAFQRMVAARIGSRHSVVHMAAGEIARVFPAVVRHGESPVVRTGPAPMYLLARLARDHGVTVALTGEGADELFFGYDIFKETAVRAFCLRDPSSTTRPRLFDRLYPYMAGPGRGGEFWRRFFLDAGPVSDPLFSHLPRCLLTSRIKQFYTPEVRDALAGVDVMEELRATLPPDFARWGPTTRAAYLEMTLLLPSYLLGAQGERMAMAHGVETRFPFLDHRLFEFAAALPPRSKLRGLREKDVLRRWAAPVVPPAVCARHKQPYRAPDAPAFFGPHEPAYVAELLSEESLRATGLFAPSAVAGLVRRCRAGRVVGVAENQALVAILSTELWHRECVAGAAADRPRVDAPAMLDAHPTPHLRATA